MSDARAADYVARYGDSSWELDALDPVVLRDLIRDAVDQVRDEDAWEDALAEENGDIREMREIVESLNGGSDDDED